MTAREKGYDSVWDKYRRRFLYYNPYCYCCGATSKVVDHIRAHKGDQELFESLTNHLPLCTGCHNYVTGKFDRYEEPDLEGKLEWIASEREHYGLTSKVKVLPYYDKKSRG